MRFIKLFNYERASLYYLSVLRIVLAFIYLQHGTAKLLGFPYIEALQGVKAFSFPYGVAGILEIVLGIFILLGLFTKIASFIASGENAFAYFLGHLPYNSGTFLYPILNGGEVAVLFSFIFLLLFFQGAGFISLDYLINRKSANNNQ